MSINPTTQSQQHNTLWIERFYRLSRYFLKKEERDLTNKIIDLAAKASTDELTIAFCGHFSAGKSSMINTLMNDELLPASPIPTSANVVMIKEGEPSVLLTDHKGQTALYKGEPNLDEVKKASKNGQDIKSVEIHKQHPYLKNHTTIIDTPGIDSVDDAHRVSTESTLHLADVIVYVMDYNHVQSELNFNFTKEMHAAGKEMYLVVNQIDKHSDDELPFTAFREETINAFVQWGVQPAGFFFTSLRDQNHKYNELGALRDALQAIKSHKHSYINQTLTKMADSLVDTYLHEQYPALDKDQTNGTKKEQIDLELIQNAEQKKRYEEKIDNMESEFNQSFKKVIENARVIPYEVRELGGKFLESLKSNFKKGLFFSGKKTENERQVRMDRYLNAVNEKAATELEWHLKESLHQILDNFELNQPELEKQIQDFGIQFTSEDLLALRHQGATFNEAYVLQYNRDVEEEVKRRYRKIGLQLFEQIKNAWLEKLQPEIESNEQERRALCDKKQKFENIETTKQQYLVERHQLHTILHEQSEPESKRYKEAVEWIDHLQEQVLNTIHAEKVLEKELMTPSKTTSKQQQSRRKDNSQSPQIDVSETAHRLESVVELLSKWGSLDDLSKRMKERISKLREKQYTVSLFGAFSAGKSSFANAWMKNDVLPVSPNPTTATINKILPVTPENPHGTVKIQVKSEENLLKELQQSLQRFGLTGKTLDASMDHIKTIQMEQPDPHYNFLKAVYNGYSTMKAYLGTEQIIDHAQLSEFVAQEERACFTESVALYYDCELTRQGINLVDTPGADSINARHTAVAFDYIKNADAIVFVTYYNHAFSKADRDFLIQLGRVKDTFSMDKMYFVINAVDLARDEEEKNTVVEYVKSQLHEYGIRNPRMYALSSKQALRERKEKKEKQHSHFESFDQSFQTLTVQERDEVAVQQATELMKVGYNRLNEWSERAQTDKKLQDEEKKRIKKELKEIVDYIDTYSFATSQKAIRQETKELLYYVVHRLMLTFNDEFKLAFNPAVLSRKDIKKDDLDRCLHELFESMAFQLAQELRATSLRIEKFLNIQQQRNFESIAAFTSERSRSFYYIPIENDSLATPEIEPEWPESMESDFAPVLKQFKNPKHFFESDGKRQMREQLAHRFQPILEQVVETYTDAFKDYYIEQIKKRGFELKKEMKLEVQQYYGGLLQAYASTERLGELQQTITHLKVIIQEQEGVLNEN